MNKEQIELYQLKKKDLSETDKIYISGFKAAIDYLKIIKSEQIHELINATGNMGYMGRRIVDLMHDDLEERMVDRMFHEIETLSEPDEFDLDVIPDADYDLDDEDIEDLDFDVEDEKE